MGACCATLMGGTLPSTVVSMTEEEEAPYVAAMQGTWKIQAISNPNETTNAYVKPIAFEEAIVTGKTGCMQGGAGRTHTAQYKFSKEPSTGQVYLDAFGSIVVTPGWPHERPMAGQAGEVIDFSSMGAYVRWVRKVDGGSAPAFGAAQQAPAAPVMLRATPVAGAEVAKPAEERLAEVKSLYDKGLLTEEEHAEKRKQILDAV